MISGIRKYGFKQGLPYEFEHRNLRALYSSSFNELIIPHRADFYQIIWFKTGFPKHVVDLNTIEIIPNTILFVDKNSVQCFDKTEQIDGEVLLFTDNFFCKTEEDTKFLMSNMLFNDMFSVTTLKIKKLIPIFNSFFKFIKTELANDVDIYSSDIIRNQLKNLLLISEREKQNQNNVIINKGTDLDFVIKFRDLIDKHFKVQKSVTKYTFQLNVTQKRLSSATLKVMAITPKHMIDARVILEAKRLLVHTVYSVKEIGYTLGFEEPTNFVKYFKKHQSITPTEFRNRFSR
ncbi:helix-turn-helix domain-containing protein [Winogradskyella undariae]|uniref:helix-turn-helix domain-containing protein n=1 Tax=Winogradskyella TaxID=286104 RepID=UPI00156A80DC|nr:MULTISPECIES: helix-turn-helix domain-containing protein [Winogradskyella]NRR93070.1 helix-turn-helix domain-containing protein [Winogradskyella undariae]QXP79316.1 helix-turn-helix domain-containing protein [Winogradskyella sp. HaHa_3_26]